MKTTSFPINEDILLREVTIEDAAPIYNAIDAHREYMRVWLPFTDNLKSVADEETFLNSVLSVSAERREPVFVICNENNEVCGLIGFHFTDFDNHRTEIGYWLLPEYQYRGIMTACVRRLCQWAVEEWGMKRIQIRCAVGNSASNGIPIRLGFQQEGTERAGELLSSGNYVDIHVYSILKEDIQDDGFKGHINLPNECTLKWKGLKMLQGLDVVTYCTINEEGCPRPAPLSKIKVEDDYIFWFATSIQSHKVAHIHKNAQSGISYYKNGDSVCLTGNSEVITDRKIKEEMWQGWFIKHFPGGIEDKDYCLIRFKAEEGTFYIDEEFGTYRL